MGDKLPLINIGTQSSASKVICGGGYTCILFANKKVKCFGMSYYGQTGYELSMTKGTISNDMGDNLPFVPLGSGVEIESIFAYNSGNHNCVILATSSSMICWGLNNYGQLGTGDQTNRGYAAGTMGDNLATIDLGTTSTVKTIGVGYSFTCALRTDDVLLCFGDNSNGQLGIGASTTPIKDMGVLLTPTSYGSGKKIMQIIGGNSHLCVLFDDNLTLKCIGGNGSDQLGQGDTLNRGAILPTTIPNIPAIDLGTGSLQISFLKTIPNTNYVVFADNSVKSFGDGLNGELGTGSQIKLGDESGEMGSNLPFLDIFSTWAPTNAPSTLVPSKAPARNPTKLPTKNPTSKPSKAPLTLNPTKSPDNTLCNYRNQKKCEKDFLCDWKEKKEKCVVFDCTKFAERSECIIHPRCDWKKGACRLQPK